MRFMHKLLVHMHERGLLFKDGDFIKFIMPGKYRLYGIWHRYAVERYATSEAEFERRLEDYLVEKQRAAVNRLFHVVETGAGEVALVHVNGRIVAVLEPAERKLFRKGVSRVRVTRCDLNADMAPETLEKVTEYVGSLSVAGVSTLC